MMNVSRQGQGQGQGQQQQQQQDQAHTGGQTHIDALSPGDATGSPD